MAKLGKQTVNNIRSGRIHSPKAIPWSYALREIFSEEFDYVIDIITKGYRTGRAKKNDNRNG